MEGRAYSELYVLRAFLVLNTDFEILLFKRLVGQAPRGSNRC
jgi:hypothetical protein